MKSEAWTETKGPSVGPSFSCWEDGLLSWFSGLGIQTIEKKHQLGAFAYHYFETRFTTPDGRFCSTHGRSQNRKTAAVKAVAEFAERKFMTEFFMNDSEAQSIPRGFRTSNGWAVHSNLASAERAAFSEALERHLLLKAYFFKGWEGFRLVHRVDAEGMEIHFLQSRFTAGPYSAGLVVAKSGLYPGVSFGYCVGLSCEIQDSRFWEPALHEAIDKIILLNGQPIDLSIDPGSWLLAEVKIYLETPFDEALLGGLTGDLIETALPQPTIRKFDLKEKWDLDFPLWAAFARADGLIPLCSLGRISAEEQAALRDVLQKNGLENIPKRHPIL